MLRNYFKVMIRNLLKRKGFTLINLIGLSTGMAICILLVLYIQNELGYDNFHERGDQIYRLAMERKYPGRSAFRAVPKSIGPAVKTEFPEVKEVVHVVPWGTEGWKVEAGEKKFTETEILAADSNFFNVFTGYSVAGDVTTALNKPATAVLNETTAKKYFGTAENAMGKQIIINQGRWMVSGVCKDWPEKSHFQFSILLTMAGDDWLKDPQYVYFGPPCYILLDKNASASALQARLPLIVDKYVAGQVEKAFGERYDKFVAEGNGYNYFLQSIKDIHLHSDLEDELKPTSSIRSIQIFGAVSAFILFLACINFINLSTALSIERAREVGIRKTFGSQKRALMSQFLSESVFFSFISMLFSLLLVFLLIPVLNGIAGINLSFSELLHPLPLLSILGFSIFVGAIAGVYPAIVLSSFNPMVVLRGRFKTNRRGIALRNGLVVFQFTVSVILIITTIVVNRQMKYVLSDKLGLQRDHIIKVDGIWHLINRTNNTITDNRQAFVAEISRIPGVELISKCDALPGSDEGAGGATWVALDNNNNRTEKLVQADDNYLNLLGLQLKEGRFFSKNFTTDSFGLIMNESAVKDFNLKNPIGARIISKEPFLNPPDGKGQYVYTVIGVVKDYHFQSLYKKVAPLVVVNSNKFGWGSAAIRINPNNFKTALASIGETWRRFDQKDDLRFSFLDQDLAKLYKTQETEQEIFNIFSILAILIACIGLFGLAAFSTLQRRKEISIRKVLGAVPGNIAVILSKDFLRLIVIASLIAFPIAWWAMYAWLQNFAYRVNISWWIFLLAAAIAAGIAMLTISYQAIKAAFANPLKSLKTE